MPYTDLPIDRLRSYAPDLATPPDLATFWADTMEQTRSFALDVLFEPVETGLRLVETFDVTFRGFGGAPIRAWLLLPAGWSGPLPAVVQFVGYGGGRGTPHEHLFWASAGYAHFVMDTRGQGSLWSAGDTPDTGTTGSPHADGVLTDGIERPETYYYRRLIADAVRAVQAVRAHPRVDADRVAVAGVSQGGGLSLAAAALVPDLAAVMADVPFMSDYPRAIRISTTDPYLQVARYLQVHRARVAQIERTLAYFDVAVLGRLATAPALFSVALMDEVCPPSTVYAAFNHYGGPKEIREYEFNNHEGGQQIQEAARLEWLNTLLGRREPDAVNT